jgi:hypothetical protein
MGLLKIPGLALIGVMSLLCPGCRTYYWGIIGDGGGAIITRLSLDISAEYALAGKM